MNQKALVIDIWSLTTDSLQEAQRDFSLLLGDLLKYQYKKPIKIRLDIGNYCTQKNGETANILTSSVPRLHLVLEGKDLDEVEHWLRPTIASLPSFHFLEVYKYSTKALTKSNLKKLSKDSLEYYYINTRCSPISSSRDIKIKWYIHAESLVKQSH